jgi:hypothetical protein
MVFGNTYCAISHLEIKDGDECYLIPLGFNLHNNFRPGNGNLINSFAYLHHFIDKPCLVKFNGNHPVYVEDSKYHNKDSEYKEYEMFMLIHKQFYESILNEINSEQFESIKYLSPFNTVRNIYDELYKEKIIHDGILFTNYKLGVITEEEYYCKRKDTPEWCVDIYKIATFMGKMGIPPHPNWAIDQVNYGEIYEKIRKSCVKN